MSKNEKHFSGEKAVVINAAYDALDSIGIAISKSNSSRGTLIVSSVDSPTLGGRIAISPELSKDGTVVEVFPFTDDERQSEWISAFFDEMQSLMKRVGLEGTR
ncbi:MAG: hypothetical protein PHT34_07430 [Oscillospiraceae bacterium]|nr:hypothetical protein [Oscillospiraceae bacterium]